MRSRPFLSLGWHTLLCAAVCGAFLFVSVPRVWQAVRATSFGPVLPYHTTNSYMVGLLKVHNGSERLVQAISSLPPNRPVAVVLADGDEESIFLSYLVSYFAWPRESRSVPVTGANAASQLQSVDRDSVAAIFFCGIEPPPGMQPVVRIGSLMVMIPMTGNPGLAAP